MSHRAPSWNQIQNINGRGVGTIGPPGPPGPSSGQYVAFTFATPSPGIIQALTPSTLITRVAVLITTAFDVPAVLRIGTFADPGLFLDVSGTELTVAGLSLVDPDLYVIGAPDSLVLVLAATGATQGAGLIYY